MKTSVMVSVVIPVFNGREHLRQALDSAVSQTVRDLEIIVVDDGSTDGTPSLVTNYSDPRVTLLTQANAGPSAARNRGIKHATGRYVAFLDADDRWAQNKLEDQLAALAVEAGCRWAYSSAVTTSNHNQEIQAHTAIHRGEILCALMRQNCITGSASSVIAERELLLEIGGFDETLGYAEDWELWARLAASSPVACSESFGVYLQRRENSYGADVEKMRADSLRFLNKAFCSYALGCARMRPAATAWIHFVAGLGLRAQRRHLRALLAFGSAIGRYPLWIRPYASILATITPQPIRLFLGRFKKSDHVAQQS